MIEQRNLIVARRALLTTVLLCMDSHSQANARILGAQSNNDMAMPLLNASSRQLATCYPDASKALIESTTGEVIAMFDFQVLSSGIDVALKKDAFQSSNLGTRFASLAVDGNATTFSHTNDVNSVWGVNLGGTFSTELVKIKNRWCFNPSDPNGCLCRLSNASLSLMNEEGTVVRTKNLGNTCGVLDLSFDMSSCSPSPPSPTLLPTTPPTTPPTPSPTQTAQSRHSITFSDAIITGDDSFEITFYNPMDQTNIFAAVVSNSACTSDNSSFEIDSNTDNAVWGSANVTVSTSMSELITAEDRNSGSVKLNFCLRADVWTNGFASSLVASKVSVGIAVSFEDSSNVELSGPTFQLEIETQDFSGSSVEYTSERGVHLLATLGECASPSSQGPYGIGSTLKLCVKSTDADVVISALYNVSFIALDGNPILEIVDSAGKPSFVTSIAGLDSKSVDVATMMATTIYDQGYGGTTITMQGTVSVTYINSNSGRRRRLKYVEESQPFALKVAVGGNTKSQDDQKSSSLMHRVFDPVTAALVAGFVFIFC